MNTFMTKSDSKFISARSDTSISDTLVFRLIVTMNLLSGQFAETHGATHGLSLAEWRCLICLATFPGVSGADTAYTIGMDTMSVSRNLGALELKGYANRTPDPKNKKRWQWCLTDAGWMVYDKIVPNALESDRQIWQIFSEDDQVRLKTGLDAVIAELSVQPETN